MLHPNIHRLQVSLALLATLLLSATAVQGQGIGNTATGTGALMSVTTGIDNSAFGFDALERDTTASGNTAVGLFSLRNNSTGNGVNTAVGYNTLPALLTGTNNTVIGQQGGKSYTGAESNNILIGSFGVVNDNNTIRIGSSQSATFVAGIDGVTVSGGTAMYVNSLGQLGTLPSSLRFKEDVLDMGDASRGILALRPVTFHYKPAYDDGSHLLQYGLVAEEVAKVFPGLVQYDKNGKPLAVRYQFVNVMLLNEVQQQHREIEELKSQVQALLAQRQAAPATSASAAR